MSSYLTDIKNSLAAGLQTAVGTDATVSAVNWIEVNSESLSTPKVYVAPGEMEFTRISRTQSQVETSAIIFIGKKVSTDADVESITDLADEIIGYIRAHDWSNDSTWPDGITSPTTITLEINPDDGLNERNQWRAIANITYTHFVTD